MLTKAVRIWLAYGVAIFVGVTWLCVAVGALVAAAGDTTMQRGLSLGAAIGLLCGALAGLIGGVVAAEELSKK